MAKTNNIRRSFTGKQQAFTIVELLIVIVIIAILAALTIVAFNGMSTRAAQSAVKKGVSDTAKRIELDKVTRGSYASDLATLANSTANSENVSYQYTGTATSYCLTGTLKNVTFYVSNTSTVPSEGICSGHDAPVTGPISDPVVHTQTGSFDQPQPASGGLNVPIAITYDLQPTDYVFVLFNSRNNTGISLLNGASSITKIYDRSMGNSGYQWHSAFGISGLSGPSTLTANACWTTSCTYQPVNVNAAYIVYVIRGLGGAPTVTSTFTPYGVEPALSAVVAPTAQSLSARKVAIFSNVYYGNTLPAEGDQSSPALTWTTDSTAPPAHLGTAIMARHTYTTAATSVQYQNTMPASGTRYHGSVLFTIR